MGKIQQISSDFWRDEWATSLDSSEKLLFIYLITNPDGNIAGVYQIPLGQIALDTGIESELVGKMLSSRFKGKVLYREGWVCVKNRLKYNRNDSEMIQKGIENILSKAPDFIREFMDSEDKNRPYQYGKRPYRESHIDIDKDIDIDISSFVEKWNRFAKENGLSECLKITAKRRTAFISKRDDINKNIDKILEKIKESDFLLGKNDRGWKVTLDFLLDRKDSLIKILEGGYNGKARGSAKQSFIDAIGSGDFGVPAHKRG